MRTSAEVDKSVGNRFAYRASDTPKGRVSWTIRVNPLSPTTFKKARFFKRAFLRLEFVAQAAWLTDRHGCGSVMQ